MSPRWWISVIRQPVNHNPKRQRGTSALSLADASGCEWSELTRLRDESLASAISWRERRCLPLRTRDFGFAAKLRNETGLQLRREFLKDFAASVFETQVARHNFGDGQDVNTEW